jgi:hypothetical protein
MGTVSRVHTFSSGAILTAAQLNNEFDNLLTSSAINGGLDATNLGVTAGQATASKALVVDSSRNLADGTAGNRINNLALSGTFESTGLITATAGITSGSNIVSDTDSTDDLGTTSVRWANLYADSIGDSGQALAVKATTLSFDAASTIDTSGNNNLTLDAGTATLTLDAGTIESDAGTLSFDGAASIDTSGNNALAIDTGSANLNITAGTLALTGAQTISSTLGVSGNVTISKDAPQLIMTDSGSGGGTSDIIIDAIGSNHGFYFRADGSTNHVILESNGDFKVDADTLYIDASADRAGVNNASPQAPLHIIGGDGDPGSAHSGDAQLILENNGTTFLEIATDTSHFAGLTFSDGTATRGAVLYDHGTGLGGGADSMHFQTAGSIRSVITSDGLFGFGTVSPASQVQAHFTGNVGSAGYMVAQNGYYVGLAPNDANETKHIDDSSNGGGTSSIYIGNEVIQTSSDIRAKKNISDYTDSALSVLDKARVVEFEYRPEVINDDSEYGPSSRGKYVGLIAQEMIEYARWAVNDGEGDPEGEHIWTAKYELMVPLLIKAVQELTQRVTELENN